MVGLGGKVCRTWAIMSAAPSAVLRSARTVVARMECLKERAVAREMAGAVEDVEV